MAVSLILAAGFVSCQQAPARMTPPAVETIETEGLIALGDVDGSQDVPNRIPRHQIFTMRPDGTNRVKLTHDSGSQFFQNWMPAWSPDGKKIAYVHHTMDGLMRIKVMDADGGNPLTLTTTGVSMAPAWSPDGTLIAYAHTSTQNTGLKLWLMNADGTNQRAFTTGPGHTDENIPTWSPDGKQIAFTSSREGGKYRIWVINADESNPVPLTTAYYDTALQADIEQKVPAWSPDGRYIAYWQGVEANDPRPDLPRDVWVMRADGRDQRRLVPGDGPAWSPDSATISHPDFSTGRLALGGISPDGTNQRVLFFTNGSFARASWQPATPPRAVVNVLAVSYVSTSLAAESIAAPGSAPAFHRALGSTCPEALVQGNSDQDATWSPPRQLSHGDSPARILFNFGRAIGIDAAGVIHVAWVQVEGYFQPGEELSAIGPVVYLRSGDDGRSWSKVPLAALGGPPRVAAAGPHVYVAWHAPADGQLRIFVRHSGDHGNTWEPPVQISDEAGAAWPSITAWGDTAHLVWGDGRTGNAEVYLRSTPDAGRSWMPTRAVSSHDGISSWTPAVASWGPAIHVAWTDERHNRGPDGLPFDCGRVGAGDSCREEEYYRRSLDLGHSWDPEVRLSHDRDTPQSSWAPSIAASGDDVHLAFFDRRSGSWDIYYARSRSAGAAGSWESERAVAQARGGALQLLRPSLAALGTDVDVVFWGQAPDGTSDVYAVSSTSTGQHFAYPTRLTAGSGNYAVHPSLAVSPRGRLHAVWYDRDARGVDQIFHAAREPRR